MILFTPNIINQIYKCIKFVNELYHDQYFHLCLIIKKSITNIVFKYISNMSTIIKLGKYIYITQAKTKKIKKPPI